MEVQKLEDQAAYLDKYGPAEELKKGLSQMHQSNPAYDGVYDGAGGGAWAQQYDENAQAYFWYNETTGEASWTDPNSA